MLSGKELKIKRIISDKKAVDVASAIGISKSYLSKLEREVQQIPVHIYEKWIDALELHK